MRTIRSYMILMLIVSVIMTLVFYRPDPDRLQWTQSVVPMLFVILIINLVGALVATIVTSLFGFPTDGGYRNHEIRQEQESKKED